MYNSRTPIPCWIAIVCFLFSMYVSAGGVSPYLPEKLSPVLENEIDRLATVAGIPNLTKPYSLATVYRYMELIHGSHPHLYTRLLVALKPYQERVSITHAKVTAGYSDEKHPMANRHGNYTDALASVSIRGQLQAADWLGFYVGGIATYYDDLENNSEFSQLNGSVVSIGTSWAQLDLGYRDFWMSPFQGSAQLLSTHAQTMPSITLSNNLPIEFLGARWNYTMMLAQMSRQPVLYQGALSDKEKPLLAGVHLSVQPTPWWSLGATRMFQFAGGERPRDFSTLVKAFFDPRGSDNDATVDEESGNQIAAISSKINFDGAVPFSFSVELAGEDTSNNKDYQLGNSALTTGLYFPYFFSENISVSYEYADWQDAWYGNNVYPEDGYSYEEFVLGHWAMDGQRRMRTALEGTSHFVKLQWQLPFDHVVSAIGRTTEHQDTATIDYAHGWEVELDYSVPFGEHTFTLGTYFGRDNFDKDFSRVSIALEW